MDFNELWDKNIVFLSGIWCTDNFECRNMNMEDAKKNSQCISGCIIDESIKNCLIFTFFDSVNYEFFIEDDNFMGLGYLFRNCRFYIEVSGKKQILLECGVYSNESPDRIWLMQIPEKYKNDFIMLWRKVHKEDVEWNREQMKKYDEDCEKRRINNTDKYKGFYKQCYKTLAKSVHPDEGGDTEAMKCLNQLKIMWEI